MQNIKRSFARASAALFMVAVTVHANAASVIDSATKTAITDGFTSLKDTMLDVLAVAFPFVVAGSVILASPSIVKQLIRLASSR